MFTQQGSRPKTKLIHMNSESVRIYLVAAMGANRVIGNGPNIPGKFRVSRRFFADSLREKSLSWGERPLSLSARPLPNRHTLVISRQANYRATGCVVVSTLSSRYRWHPSSAMNSTSLLALLQNREA